MVPEASRTLECMDLEDSQTREFMEPEASLILFTAPEVRQTPHCTAPEAARPPVWRAQPRGRPRRPCPRRPRPRPPRPTPGSTARAPCPLCTGRAASRTPRCTAPEASQTLGCTAPEASLTRRPCTGPEASRTACTCRGARSRVARLAREAGGRSSPPRTPCTPPGPRWRSRDTTGDRRMTEVMIFVMLTLFVQVSQHGVQP